MAVFFMKTFSFLNFRCYIQNSNQNFYLKKYEFISPGIYVFLRNVEILTRLPLETNKLRTVLTIGRILLIVPQSMKHRFQDCGTVVPRPSNWHDWIHRTKNLCTYSSSIALYRCFCEHTLNSQILIIRFSFNLWWWLWVRNLKYFPYWTCLFTIGVRCWGKVGLIFSERYIRAYFRSFFLPDLESSSAKTT